MKKIVLLIVILLPMRMVAQVFRTSNQQLIEDAVRSGLVIYSQSYQLKDTISNQIYGRNGSDEFGKSYTIGVKIENHLMVPKSALSPWDNDPNYQRYISTHKPLLFKSSVRIIGDSTKYECHPTLDTTSVLLDNLYIQLKDTTCLKYSGFTKDEYYGDKKGWLVWITADNGIEMSDSIIRENLMIYKKDIIVSTDSLLVKVDKPQTEKKIWGGIYLTPQQVQLGTIQFLISGILHCVDEQWYIYTPFCRNQDNDNVEENELTPVVEDGNDASENLTAKKSKKKTKKNKRTKTN